MANVVPWPKELPKRKAQGGGRLPRASLSNKISSLLQAPAWLKKIAVLSRTTEENAEVARQAIRQWGWRHEQF